MQIIHDFYGYGAGHVVYSLDESVDYPSELTFDILDEYLSTPYKNESFYKLTGYDWEYYWLYNDNGNGYGCGYEQAGRS